jgi:hypothetical protein
MLLHNACKLHEYTGGADVLTDCRSISRQYWLSGECTRDVIASIPFQLLALATGGRWVLACRMGRILRITRYITLP